MQAHDGMTPRRPGSHLVMHDTRMEHLLGSQEASMHRRDSDTTEAVPGHFVSRRGPLAPSFHSAVST